MIWLGGPDSNDLTIRISEPPNFDGGVRVWRWRICAKLAEQMVQLLKGTLPSFNEEKKKDKLECLQNIKECKNIFQIMLAMERMLRAITN